jgi:hypothetical protein
MSARRRNSAGGAAAGSGIRYQSRVAAWLAVHVLAERDATVPWDVHASAEWLGCETGQPVDDILVEIADGARIYIQAKRTLTLSPGAESDLGSAIHQCVQQYLETQPREAPVPPDPAAARDRLIIATGARSSGTIRNDLKQVITRTRTHPAKLDLDAAATNASERQAHKILLGHVERAWISELGRLPTDREVRGFLELLWIDVVAVEDGEVDEQRAKDLLRMVLENPDQADAAWRTLIEHCAALISGRSSSDRKALHNVLFNAGIRVRGRASYRDDIHRLKEHSETVTRRLADNASIALGSESVQIDRPYMTILREEAEEGPMLVVGEPGAGKSGLLHQLAVRLRAEARDVVVIAVQDPPFNSPVELRGELDLQHEFTDVLANWPGDRPAFLLIDGLDAARTDPSAQAVRRLIRDVTERAERWHVVASIREYDVRYSRDLRRLFAGDPISGPMPQLAGMEFAGLRHLVVGRLTRVELEQLALKSPQLDKLLRAADPALVELLGNPFNLRLAAALLEGGIAPDEIRLVRSQLDLLDLYWDERVLAAGDARQADAREAVVGYAARQMVQDRSLSANRAQIASDPAASSALADLLSAHVLIEWASDSSQRPDRYILVFAHNILFDYAVERLLLRGSASHFATLLAADPGLVLVARPSLVMHFHHLWEKDRVAAQPNLFWEAVLVVARSPGIPEIGKLIGPNVAAETVRSLTSAQPLLDALQASEVSTREAAENAFNHLIRSLMTDDLLRNTLVGDKAGPWCKLVAQVSQVFSDRTAYTVRAILGVFLEQAPDLMTTQLSDLGIASRGLLEYSWRRQPRDRFLIIHSLQYVSRTFASNPTASATLLRRAIDPEHVAKYGSEELPWLANEVDRLLEHDRALVRDLYLAAFNYRERSEEPTPMGGIVMPLISNRRQDYGGALYRLETAFPHFLRQAPEHAIIALNSAVEAHLARERQPTDRHTDLTFDCDGIEARIVLDYSFIWDRGHAYPDEDALKLLDHLEDYLSELSGPDGDGDQLRAIIVLLVRSSRTAGIWRRLLRLGARFPGTVGMELRSLAWSRPVLTGNDTSVLAGRMIQSIMPHLGATDRERIERAILAIPVDVNEEHLEYYSRLRDRLLGCFPLEPLVSEARERLALLLAQDTVPKNEDPVRFETSWETFGEVEYLREQGVPVDDMPNRRIRELEVPVREFGSRFLNNIPTHSDALEILHHLRTLFDALQSSGAGGVHAEQATYAWGALADACAAIAKIDDLSCADPVGSFIRDVLLEASTHQVPLARSDADAKFVRPHWGAPAPRVDAAEGLLSLALDASCDDEAVWEAIDRLGSDAAPEVRYQIILRIHGLYRHGRERFWCVVDRCARTDQSPGVLRGLITGPLFALRFIESDRVAQLAAELHRRAAGLVDFDDVQKGCMDIIGSLYLRDTHDGHVNLIFDIVDRPREHLATASHLAGQLREILIEGPVDESDPGAHAARRRALDLSTRLASAAAEAFLSGAESYRQGSPDITDEELTLLGNILDRLGWNVYFASGAYSGDNGSDVTSGQQARFLIEAGSLLDALGRVGIPSITHHLFETLEVLIPFDPAGVFMRITGIVRSGQSGGYQYDHMAEDVLVRVVERYLADYRAIFQESRLLLDALIELLDTFVNAGSIRARKLSYGLDAIFR